MTFSVLSSGAMLDNMDLKLANNNSGDITAEDVRVSMKDIVASIPNVVSNANFNGGYPFQQSVRAERVNGQHGLFIAESGIQFDSVASSSTISNIQVVPYPGNELVDHNLLDNLATGDVHTQYLNVDGQRVMEGNLGLDTFWINSVGNDDGSNGSNNRGLQFSYDSGSSKEIVHVGDDTKIEFDFDNSTVSTSKGNAKAWLNFSVVESNGSINITILKSYNISRIDRISAGKYVIRFKRPVRSPYVAIGSSNARSTNGSEEDFDLNTVGIVDRQDTYLTYAILKDNNQFVDGAMNDLVVFGLSNDSEDIDSTTTTTTVAPQ